MAEPPEQPVAAPSIFEPQFRIAPPDFGEPIPNLEAYVSAVAKKTAVFIIADGRHDSLAVQDAINEIMLAAKPKALAVEFNAGDVPLTSDNVLETLDSERKRLQEANQLDQNTEIWFALMKERFQLLKDAKTPFHFIDTRTPVEGALLQQMQQTVDLAETVQQIVPSEEGKKDLITLHELAKRNTLRINTPMEANAAASIKKLYDEHKGNIVVIVGRNHISKEHDINERLKELGVPAEDITMLSVQPVRDLPPKSYQKGGQNGVDATVYVEDKDKGLGWPLLGGKVISSVDFPTIDELQKIYNISFKTRPEGNAQQVIALEMVTDPKNPMFGRRTVDVSLPGLDKPVIDELVLTYGAPLGENKILSVNVDVRGLPVKMPGEQLTEEAKKAWLDKLEPALKTLLEKVNALPKPPPDKAREVAIPHHGLENLAALQPLSALRR